MQNIYANKLRKYQNKLQGGMSFFSKSKPIPKPTQIITPDTSSLILIDTKEFKYEELSVKIEKYKGKIFVKGDDGNGAYWQAVPDRVQDIEQFFVYILVDDKYVLFLNHQCYSEIINRYYFSKISLDTLEKLKVYICELNKKEEKQNKIKNEQDKLKSKLEIFDSNPKNNVNVKTEIDKITKNIDELPIIIANKDANINKLIGSLREKIITDSDSIIERINKYGY
jgi:hypothetical protein